MSTPALRSDAALPGGARNAKQFSESPPPHLELPPVAYVPSLLTAVRSAAWSHGVIARSSL